jgi:amino acid adenylation domain-containing protein
MQFESHNQTIHAIIERQVENTPDAIAVKIENSILSYSELNKRANKVAGYLIKSGIVPDIPVGVLMERSFEMVIAILAILKAGGAYIPFDPGYPNNRLKYMVENSRVKYILTRKIEFNSLEELNDVIPLFLDEPSWCKNETEENPQTKMNSTNLAYVIYTSGSTGNPKGAMNAHNAIVNRLLWMKDELKLNDNDIFIQKTPFSFDVSVWELLLPLMIGARLIIAKPGGHRDPEYLIEMIHKEKISIIHFVPSMLRIFLCSSDTYRIESLNTVVCSGEALNIDVAKNCLKRINANLYNFYGPTEAAVDVTFYKCRIDELNESIPIGRPIWNTNIYILNEAGLPVDEGVPGEIYIGGIAVGRGYLNNLELTSKSFVNDPFCSVSNALMYKTGDLGRVLKNGNIEYLGRIDFQVKIRGFRIELNEIENVLRKINGVKDCVVLVKKDLLNEDRLIAYVVEIDNGTLSDSEIKQELSLFLPEYMVPSYIEFVSSFPVTPNGKMDRSALPMPWEKDLKTSIIGIESLNETEKTIAEIWIKILNSSSIDLNKNFLMLAEPLL